MALKQCPECSRDVSDKARTCPGCGYPLQPKKRRTRKTKTRVNKTTGYRGIKLIRLTGQFRPSLKYQGVRVDFPDFATVEEAVKARNEFIINHPDLPSKYSVQEII